MRACDVARCDEKHYGLGLCQKHYHRLRRTGSAETVRVARRVYPSVAERLAARSERRGDCLIYTAGTESQSGHVQIRRDGQTIGVHVAAWELANGRRRRVGEVVRHSCDTPRCIEPSHLLSGSVADNNRDRDVRGRHVALRGEENGMSKLTDANVRDIRAQLARGIPQWRIGEQFGVSQGLVSLIARGKSWAHVA